MGTLLGPTWALANPFWGRIGPKKTVFRPTEDAHVNVLLRSRDVGVGLLGVEGRQAANAADSAVEDFSVLELLLLVHGRRNLRRTGIAICHSVHKNALLVGLMVLLSCYTRFSGTTLYDSVLLTVYNLLFTSLPVLVFGVSDIDSWCQACTVWAFMANFSIYRCS